MWSRSISLCASPPTSSISYVLLRGTLVATPTTPKERVLNFMNWINRYHPTVYLYAGSRACGESCQDIGVEGAIAVLMKLTYYLEFLIWIMRCGHGDGILEHNLFHVFSICQNDQFLVCPINTTHYSLHAPPMARWE